MILTYAEARDKEQLKKHDQVIDKFIQDYNSFQPSPSPCPRQTVFFFPGGMASRLVRARDPFQEGFDGEQNFGYDTVWWDFVQTYLFGGGRNLEMQRDNTGVFRDKDDHIIVADGALNLGGITPHAGFTLWCKLNNIDLFEFNWDWRRRLDETVTFFIDTFLPHFRDRLNTAGCVPDPLAKFSLVGHSFGGMIVNLILRSNHPRIANLSRAITVGTPFYGYGGQLHRWFEGDATANGPFGMYTPQIIRVISTLPSLYTVLYLDEATFNDSANHAALTSPLEEFPLPAYPSTDAATGAHADPYDPQPNGAFSRYRTDTGFNLYELDYARLQVQQMAATMVPELLQKFYNVRGVISEGDPPAPTPSTVGSVTWDWVPPIDPSPIVDGALVPGDDTQPAWTTRLVKNDPARCPAVKAPGAQHMLLMSSPATLNVIASILCAPVAAMTEPVTPASPLPEPASQELVTAFFDWLHELRKKIPRHLDQTALDELIPARFKDSMGAIGLRIMMDMVRGPVSRKGQKPRGGAPAARGSRPAGKRAGKASAAAPRKKAAGMAARRKRSKRGRS